MYNAASRFDETPPPGRRLRHHPVVAPHQTVPLPTFCPVGRGMWTFAQAVGRRSRVDDGYEVHTQNLLEARRTILARKSSSKCWVSYSLSRENRFGGDYQLDRVRCGQA